MGKNKKSKTIFGENLYVGPLSIVMAVAVGYLFKYAEIPETNIAIAFLLAIVAISMFTQNYIVSLVYSVVATLAFNYFFTVPYMAFEIGNVSYFITFVIMVTVSLIISMLAQRLKNTAIKASRSAEENRALYIFTNLLSAASGLEEIIQISLKNISRISHSKSLVYYYSDFEKNNFGVAECSNGNVIYREHGTTSEISSIEELREKYESDKLIKQWNITGRDGLLALIHLPAVSITWIDESQRRVIGVMLESMAMAMDRYFAAERQNHLQRENEKERYRSNLLRAISHDLRTPLSGIMGTSEMIMDMTDSSDNRYELAKEIREDADWLHSLMENILNLTKLEEDSKSLKKQPEALEEIIAVTLDRFEKRAPDRELLVSIPDELMIVPMDAKLIVQVLINLLDNSLKHTTQEQEISLSVEKQGDNACFIVADRGTGISEEDLPYIFQMYYTSAKSSADAKKGMGLGLAICNAVVKAHGGTITACNRDGGGAVFTFTLPMEADINE